LREDELDAACCKQLIPGVVLLPPQENQGGMTMAVAIGILLDGGVIYLVIKERLHFINYISRKMVNI